MGVRLSGDAARVLVRGRWIGNLYRWSLEGQDGDWRATAAKYWLVEKGEEMEFQFFLDQLELRGTGRITTKVVTDGNRYRETVEVKGNKIWVPMLTPSVSS